MLTKSTIKTVDGEVEIDATAFKPDWIHLYTINQMEEDLNPFKFKGVGWYLSNIDSMLILPYPVRYPYTPEIYLVCVWNHCNAGQAFSWIANAPIHEDTRLL